MKLLILYGTTEGHTRKICRFLQTEAQQAGHAADLFDAADNPPDPAGYDRILVAASMHVGSYQSAVEHYVHSHREALNARPTAFVSVSLAAAGHEEKSLIDLREKTQQFFDETGWQPKWVEYAAGALLYTEYNFFKRFVMRLIAKQAGGDTDTEHDYEYTDWPALAAFLKQVATQV